MAQASHALTSLRAESYGTCKLTGVAGKFVASHLLPRALTHLSRTGEKYVEAGIGLRVKRRPASWYDPRRLTREGEDILARIDSRGIEELRRLLLVWSGWDGASRLPAEELVGPVGNPTHRVLDVHDPEGLQLFFLSLLWRAGATQLPEFDFIELTSAVVEDLRQRVLAQDPGEFSDYPVQLFQIIDKGHKHNRTPLHEQEPLANLDGSAGELIDYVRFYFDGLVARVHIAPGRTLPEHYLDTCLGRRAGAIAFTYTFENSRAWANLQELARAVREESKTPQVSLTPVAAAIGTAWPLAREPRTQASVPVLLTALRPRP